MKLENLGLAALFASATALLSPAPALADGDEAEYEAEADVRVCIIKIQDEYYKYVRPYGVPGVDFEYLSIQGDYDKSVLQDGDTPPQQYASGKAKARAWSKAQVISGGLVQWQDLKGEPLGDGQLNDGFFYYGASIGLGGRSSYAWRYKKDDWDDDDWRRGRRGACGGDEVVRVSAKVMGEAAVKRKYGPAESTADAYGIGYIDIDNMTGKPLQVLIAMDYRYCGEIERTYGANVYARTSIGVEGVQGEYSGPLFETLEADTSYRSEFCRKGTKYATIEIPATFSFQTLQINVNAGGGASTVQ